MDLKDYQGNSRLVQDWIIRYLEEIQSLPVMSKVKPGDVKRSLPDSPPTDGEAFPLILQDFENKILPGITHWQHPKFFAYFPSNTSLPCMLGEALASALAVQGMNWLTSPAATELELLVMDWLRKMCGLPGEFFGVIQDAASISTLVAMVCARERATDFQIQRQGFQGTERFRIYCSEEAHSSIEKSATVAGFGREGVCKISTDETLALDAAALRKQIERDRQDGFQPLMVASTFGTTSSTAFDPLAAIADISNAFGLWMHVDAAYAGSAFILPEVRELAVGIERADSLVFNPHKWLMTSFDCSAFFMKDKQLLLKSFSILPEYLRTGMDDEVVNLRDTSIGLGRRFRALKLWVVIRSYGVRGLQKILRQHILWTKELVKLMDQRSDVQILAPVTLNLVCFRFAPFQMTEPEIDRLNRALVEKLNQSGKLFLSHTMIRKKYALRIVLGQTNLDFHHVREAWHDIVLAAEILQSEPEGGARGTK